MAEGDEGQKLTLSDTVVAELNRRVDAWKPPVPGKDMGDGLVDVSAETVRDLEEVIEAKKKIEKIGVPIVEEKLPERRFPIAYDATIGKPTWDEQEVRKFFENPENLLRTIYCPQINNDLTDDMGMFGYGPGFIYIEATEYLGAKSFNDDAAVYGKSLGIDPQIGIGYMRHYDFFPRRKYNARLVTRSYDPRLFDVMCDIVDQKIKAVALNEMPKPPVVPPAPDVGSGK